MATIPRGPHAGNDAETTVATIWKNTREALVVKASTWNGYQLVHARMAYRDKNGELRFTKEGFTLKPGKEIKHLIEALQQANQAFDKAPDNSRQYQTLSDGSRVPVQPDEPPGESF